MNDNVEREVVVVVSKVRVTDDFAVVVDATRTVTVTSSSATLYYVSYREACHKKTPTLQSNDIHFDEKLVLDSVVLDLRLAYNNHLCGNLQQ